MVKDDHPSGLSRLAAILLSAALLAGGTAALAQADGEAMAAKKKCAKKRAVAAKKKCKKRKGSTPTTPPPATTPAPSASLAISPTSHDFGPLAIPGSTSAQTFTVTNSGPDASGTLTSSLAGTDPAFYAISSDTCNGHSLGAAASCTLDVQCQSVGALEGTRTATLTVGGDPGGLPKADLTCFLTT